MPGPAALLLALVACGPGAQRAASLPAPGAGADTTALLGVGRIARLPAAERAAWSRYVAESRRIQQGDKDLMQRELQLAGKVVMARAPFQREAFELTEEMTPEWFRTDGARRLVDVVLSYQVPSGGWSKHVDYTKGPRQPGQSWFSESDSWQYIATIDNSSTTEQLRFLGAAHRALGDARTAAAFVRGMEYLFTAQFPSGCWPQVFPLQGGYHDAATFNDDAIVHVLELMREVVRGDSAGYGFVPPGVRARAAEALRRGVGCIVASQVVVNGRRTVWGQQHDPLTLAPVKARSYELVGLAGKESAAIVRFLMGLPAPGDSAVEAVHAAVDWFRAHAIAGYDYDFRTGLVAKADAAPIWARLTDLETDKPIFSNRDGVKLYDWSQLTDRRQGYAWYGREPAWILNRYDRWARANPRSTARGTR
jgi:PelA/Pel-15E family pectate lyase